MNHEAPDLTPEAGSKRQKVDDNDGGDLVYLLEELERSSSILTLQTCGITSIQDLLERKEQLKKHGLSLKKSVQKVLSQFCEWHKDFYDKHPTCDDWKEHFDEEKLEAFASPRRSPKELLAIAKDRLRSKHRPKLDIMGADVECLVRFIASEIINDLPEHVKRLCHFDIGDYAQRWIKTILGNSSFSHVPPDSMPDIYLAFGRTQAGKSVLKAVLCAICEVLEVDVFIITKGVGESKDLDKNIKQYLEDSKHRRNLQLEDGVVHVVADTGAQIFKLVKKIKNDRNEAREKGLDVTREFVVIADECDAYIRTEAGSQVMERAYQELMNLGPLLRIEISATLMPSLIFYILEKALQVEMLRIGKSEDYSGIEEMVPFELNGSPVYLSNTKEAIKEFKRGVDYVMNILSGKQLVDMDSDAVIFAGNSLKLSDELDEERFKDCDTMESVPFTNDDVMDFYEAAASSSGKGVLLLDITNPRVNVPHNVFDKAGAVQNALFSRGIEIAVVVHVACGIYVRRPGNLSCRKITSATITEVLERLDDELGMEIPVFLFGYSKMRRCISQRSTKRVPTHILLSLGKGHSVENFVQAIGRGTFNGRESVLGANGHKHVTVLLDEEDFTAAQKYIKFLDHFVDRIKKGEKPEDALTGTSGRFPDSTNFLKHSERKIGLRKDFRSRLEDMDIFAELEDDDDQESYAIRGNPQLREKYAKDTLAQRVLFAWSTHAAREELSFLSSKEIRDLFKRCYNFDRLSIQNDELQEILEDLKADEIVEQTHRGWHVPDWDAALYLVTLHD